jgi:hypothetical protein
VAAPGGPGDHRSPRSAGLASSGRPSRRGSSSWAYARSSRLPDESGARAPRSHRPAREGAENRWRHRAPTPTIACHGQRHPRRDRVPGNVRLTVWLDDKRGYQCSIGSRPGPYRSATGVNFAWKWPVILVEIRSWSTTARRTHAICTAGGSLTARGSFAALRISGRALPTAAIARKLLGWCFRRKVRTVRPGDRMVRVAERFVIPDDLARSAAREERGDWLAELPVLVARIAAKCESRLARRSFLVA